MLPVHHLHMHNLEKETVRVLLCIHFLYNPYLHWFIVGYAWANRRRGKYIRTNSTGIQRRWKELSRGTKMAPQGRPTKRNY